MIERLHPGVYVIELPFEAKPIEGVPTPTPSPSPPDWTDHNVHDPGVTLLSLLVYAVDAGLYRPHPAVSGAAAGMYLGSGVVGGLAVHACDAGSSSRVTLSAGAALGASGRAIDHDSTTALLRVPKH